MGGCPAEKYFKTPPVLISHEKGKSIRRYKDISQDLEHYSVIRKLFNAPSDQWRSNYTMTASMYNFLEVSPDIVEHISE